MGIFSASLLVVPVTGNRNYCRFLCPYGVLYGLIGRLGFYKIEADREKCIDCGACDRNCEMGIPVSSLVKKYGQVKISDCVGCGRCVATCPTTTLKSVDVRSYVKDAACSLREFLLSRHIPSLEIFELPQRSRDSSKVNSRRAVFSERRRRRCLTRNML